MSEKRLPKVLIVDDESAILYVLSRLFKNEEYEIQTAVNGVEAVQMFQRTSFHVVLLDLNMQPMTGLDVLKELRKHDLETVVIIMTAFSTVDSAIEAIHLGAFDYLLKPADPEEIRKRVREGVAKYEQGLARRELDSQLAQLQQTLKLFNPESTPVASSHDSSRSLSHGDLTIDLYTRRACYAGEELKLTTTEYKMLVCLADSAPRPVDVVSLAQAGLGYTASQVEARELVKYHIHRLRQKIEDEPETPRHIKTIRFEGYVWCD
ncbi:Transcriptional regulatory protein OmpR [bioreactor metagenome]|uniref:Transcriptional regulatory protein OmpR n=1 Tax=bioreactor metagenome TaxID=1076179 RepID=A0A644XJQ0_9ZZZZ